MKTSVTPGTRVVLREAALSVAVLVIVCLPWFIDITAVSWAALGGVLAFAVVSPRSLVLAVPATIGLSFREFELGDLRFNLLEVLIFPSVAGYLPRAAYVVWKGRSETRRDPRILLKSAGIDHFAAGIAVLLFAGGVVSLLTVADPDYIRESVRTFRWTILLPIAFFFLLAPVLTRCELRGLASASFVAGAVIASTIAVIDGLAGGGVDADSVTRLSGLAPHPNALALYLERAAVFGLLVALLFRERISAPWLMSSGFIALVTLLTFSRGAVLALVVAVVLILLLSRARTLAIYATMAASVTTLAIIAVAPERSLSLLGGGSGSLRLELWRSSMNMARDHPITGVGLDQFLYQYLPRYVSPEAWTERFTSHPHNVLLEAWLSLGIIGPAVIVLLGILWAGRVRSVLRTPDRVSLAAGGAILAAFLHGLVDRSYFLPELAVSVWFLIAILASSSREIQSEGPDIVSKG